MAKWILKAPHYIDGTYYKAAPDDPLVVEIDDVWEPHKNPDLEKYVDDVHAEKLGQHFAEKKPMHVQSSARVQSAPVEPKAPKAPRAADKSPV